METIIIGKPAVNVYLPLQEFPQEGDLFIIRNKNESVGNVGATAACLLGKWGIACHFTGVVGNDSYAEKIRDTFKEYRVNTKYMETDFLHGTCVNYNILNAKTGVVTKVLFNNPESQLTKFKYDFIPGFAIIDGTDFAGAHALLNNNGTVKTVFYGRTGDKDTIAMSKRCTWPVVTERFVELLTKDQADGTAEGYVELYQKIVDNTGSSNYIVILNNHKILYCVDGKVKMLPEMKINVTDASSFDSVFVGALAFILGHEASLDDAIKFANTAAALSLTKIGESDSIPEIDDVLDNCGLREKLGLSTKRSAITPKQATPGEGEVLPLDPSAGVQAGNATSSSVEVNNAPVVDAFSQTVQSTPTTEVATQVPQSVQTPEMPQMAQPPQNVYTQVDNSTNV